MHTDTDESLPFVVFKHFGLLQYISFENVKKYPFLARDIIGVLCYCTCSEYLFMTGKQVSIKTT